ncbi:hypothetical protein [Yoonia sp. 2307UL14-13]|uniref:hypothetical protein n=1 Tax=Yoonia sp. 2307UL14-13 TaxID=3126506 RepID=UPI003094F793
MNRETATITAENHVFDVRRNLPKYTGWAFLALAFASVPFLVADPATAPIFGIVVAILLGLTFVLSARNVKQITVTQDGITFHPCNAQVRFGDVKKMHVPDWADRFDTAPISLASLTFEMQTKSWSFVPGAVFRGSDYCRINIYGCESLKFMNVLRQYVPEKD